MAEEVHRDPHDLALLLAQADDVVDPRRFVEGEADRHFVDDVGVEDVLDLIERPERRSGDRERGSAPSARCPMTCKPSVGWASTRSAKA